MPNRLTQYLESLPKDLTRLLPPAPTPRETELIAMGATVDIATFLLGMIPVYGDVLADIVGDNIEGDMHRRFTPEEKSEFVEQSRFLPSGLAAWRAFSRRRARGL